MRILILILLLGACSEREIYKEIQHNNEFHCYNLPVSQQEACLQDARAVDFDEYQLELKKLKKVD